jgi:hypothetical protein
MINWAKRIFKMEIKQDGNESEDKRTQLDTVKLRGCPLCKGDVKFECNASDYFYFWLEIKCINCRFSMSKNGEYSKYTFTPAYFKQVWDEFINQWNKGRTDETIP